MGITGFCLRGGEAARRDMRGTIEGRGEGYKLIVSAGAVLGMNGEEVGMGTDERDFLFGWVVTWADNLALFWSEGKKGGKAGKGLN